MNSYIGIDVGTNSVRVGLVNDEGTIISNIYSEPIFIHQTINSKTGEIHYEQSSENIWESICKIVKKLNLEIKEKFLKNPPKICAMGFDATCSLVVLKLKKNEKGNLIEEIPINVSLENFEENIEKKNDFSWNIILWMCHRAEKFSEKINNLQNNEEFGEKIKNVLKYYGYKISPEQEIPKILYLKEVFKNKFFNDKEVCFFDLCDFLTYKSIFNKNNNEFYKNRSINAVVCKWNYIGVEKKWDDFFFEKIELEEFKKENDQENRIGKNIHYVGDFEGYLSEENFNKMGFNLNYKFEDQKIVIPTNIIDAYAGFVGSLAVKLDEEIDDQKEKNTMTELSKRLCLIAGTSNCHLTLSSKLVTINGVWGPFYEATFKNYFMNEGGESAVGNAIDFIVQNHSYYKELLKMLQEKKNKKKNVYELLDENLEKLRKIKNLNDIDFLTVQHHILPYFNGNRSPIADPSLTATICGLKISNSLDDLSILYLTMIQAIAYGTRNIIEEMNKKRKEKDEVEINKIIICGSLAKSKIFIEQHVKICKIDICTTKQDSGAVMILGSAILGRCGFEKSLGKIKEEENILLKNMKLMNHIGEIYRYKKNEEVDKFHEKKYKIFHLLYQHQLDYKKIMENNL